MQCPSCHTGTLLPTRIATGGPACYQCNHCQGALLSIAPYLDWAKNAGASQAQAAPMDMDSTDTKHALGCPKCSRIMLRYNAMADKAHGLDYCFHCEEVWLDAGEWQYLVQQGLHTRITAISTDPYQRRLREQAQRDAARERFRTSVGDASFDTVEQFRAWLAGQPNKAQILRFLGQEA